MNKKILILSPHLDDVVLSCCNYALQKQTRGYLIKIITIFTDFKVSCLSIDAKIYLKKSGFNNVVDFSQARKNEDLAAMKFLGFEYEYWNLIDGCFRENHNEPIYKSNQHLFSGKIKKNDQKNIIKLIAKLKQINYKEFTEILIPLGIGFHADHLITKFCAEQSFPFEKIKYYVDWPYAFNPKNWNLKKIKFVLRNERDIVWTNKKKYDALKKYRSQIRMLFPYYNFIYPELIMKPFP